MKRSVYPYIWFFICLWLGLYLTVATAQEPSPDHSIHHQPKNANSAAPPATETTAAKPSGSPGMTEMDQMMERARNPPKELYPALMDLPDLSNERRAEIEQLAHERMVSSQKEMTAAFDRLSRASAREDYGEMQEAAARLREALAQYESGLAAHRALVEGKAPRNIALVWFKREMNLIPAATEPETRLFGLPSRWFHYFVIATLLLFVGSMVVMYLHKMRRAEKLIAQLTRSPGKTSGPSEKGGD